MSHTTQADSFADRAKQIWADYERAHDLSDRQNEAVGIDPDTGEIHFGSSMEEIGDRLGREGRFKPLFYRWVNDPSYYHFGGRR